MIGVTVTGHLFYTVCVGSRLDRASHCPMNGNDALPAAQRTHVQAVKRKGVLSDELVVRGGVVVFDDEAHDGELRHVHVELEVFVPRWVEAFSTGKKKKQNRAQVIRHYSRMCQY